MLLKPCHPYQEPVIPTKNQSSLPRTSHPYQEPVIPTKNQSSLPRTSYPYQEPVIPTKNQRGARTRACRIETYLDARSMRRDESRCGTHECVRHVTRPSERAWHPITA